jgi:hypothetical protein
MAISALSAVAQVGNLWLSRSTGWQPVSFSEQVANLLYVWELKLPTGAFRQG